MPREIVSIIGRKMPELVAGCLVPRGLSARAAAGLVKLSVPGFRLTAQRKMNFRPLPEPWVDTWDRRDIERMIGFVYVVGFGNYVKIGWTREPTSRLCGLQTGVPETLIVYGCFVGSRDDERLLHLAFDDARLRGEWFRYSGRVSNWIAEGCATREPKIIVEYDEDLRAFHSTGSVG